ncbi:MAG: hypothetical protein KKH91_06065 [Elusimicrobia bacterium]|nr:hypothetical protein [Elusimicrobiota bacterium]MBU2614147.1 hypothetical protein [Elusimicrobiota bacterium]
MNITDITNAKQLKDFMTTPSQALTMFMKTLSGDILILGGSGKMGPELVEMIIRADKSAGAGSRKIIVASTFSDPKEKALKILQSLGIAVYKGNVSDRKFLEGLPDIKNIIYMPGFKFGSSGNWEKSFHLNCIVPYLTGERFKSSNIVVFSSANPYLHTRPENGGSKETDILEPQGIYGWSIAARESAFRITAEKSQNQKICFYRLAYAQHLAYGVIVDLAKMVLKGENISLSMPYVNLVSQRDANERAIFAFGLCSNPPSILNVSGPIVSVKYILDKLSKLSGKNAKIIDTEPETALVINDNYCVKKFGAYKDKTDDIIEAAAKWVVNNGEYWDKPTMFGQVKHQY